MNKKKKIANQKHRKTKSRIKALRAISLSKIKQKSSSKKEIDNTPNISTEKTMAKKPAAKKLVAKKTTAKKPAAKKSVSKKKK